MVQGTIAREAALDVLRRVRTGQTFDLAFAAVVDGIKDADRRLTYEIAAGVLRFRTELDRRLRQLVSGDWDRTAPDLQECAVRRIPGIVDTPGMLRRARF